MIRAPHCCRTPPGTLPARALLTRPAADPTAHADPTDCDFALAPANPDDVVNATVPRASLEKVDAGGWSPKVMGYVGNQTMSGGGAFGPQYVWAHNQIDHYPTSNPQYTEYIEVSLKQPTYLASLELGSPRGMGSVVSLKACGTRTPNPTPNPNPAPTLTPTQPLAPNLSP